MSWLGLVDDELAAEATAASYLSTCDTAGLWPDAQDLNHLCGSYELSLDHEEDDVPKHHEEAEEGGIGNWGCFLTIDPIDG